MEQISKSKLIILLTFLFSFSLIADEIAAYRKIERGRSREKLILVDNKGDEIKSFDATDIKDYLILFNRLLISDIFNNVKVYDSKGELLFAEQGVTQFDMSENAFAVLRNNRIGAAYLFGEKEAFIQERNVDFIAATNNFVLMRSRINNEVKMFSFQQKEKEALVKSIDNLNFESDKLQLQILELEDQIYRIDIIEELEKLNTQLVFKKEEYHRSLDETKLKEEKLEKLNSSEMVKNIFPKEALAGLRRVVKVAVSDNFIVLEDYLGDTTIMDEYGEIIVNRARNITEFFLSDNFLVTKDWNDWVDVYLAKEDENELVYTGNDLNNIKVTNGFVSFEWGSSINLINTKGETETLFLDSIKNYVISNHQIMTRSNTNYLSVLDEDFNQVFSAMGIRRAFQLKDKAIAYMAGPGSYVNYSSGNFKRNVSKSILGFETYQISNDFLAIKLKNSSRLKLYDSRGELIRQDRFVQSISLPMYEDRYKWKVFDLNQ
ncbi:hypothetical protein N9N67_06845 [Bacteriovoracaceae bacterium]|nr:hypothetical protein [Bacteriovoracaceae bacterium]